jgi:hypothetical protein
VKIFVVHDDQGRIRSVAVPGPEFAGEAVEFVSEDHPVLAVDLTQVKELSEANAPSSGPQGLHHTASEIIKNFRIDLQSRRLVPKERPNTSADSPSGA